MKNNYHTHTGRCRHAKKGDEAYVLAAIAGGMGQLGFSDHTPWNYSSNYVSGMRMGVEELPGYVESIRALQSKYKEQIDIKLGLECEYFDEYIPWLKEITEEYKLDYLIFGNHFYKTDEKYPYIGRYTDPDLRFKHYLEGCLKGMESGMFAYLAHPDLYVRGYPEFDERCEDAAKIICKKALELDMPLEYNLEGARGKRRSPEVGYPHPEFWKIASSMGCKTIIGIDAHNSKSIEEEGLFKGAVKFLNDIGAYMVNQIEFKSW